MWETQDQYSYLNKMVNGDAIQYPEIINLLFLLKNVELKLVEGMLIRLEKTILVLDLNEFGRKEHSILG